ncbi:hypothetical protein AB0758_44140 [Tolypothrix bouteillei VB521301_2]|uniref:hypothetical protein n=1 Tax=Tolypothrix bouteillei TaxID=1246981 RepID=UPI0038B601A9
MIQIKWRALPVCLQFAIDKQPTDTHARLILNHPTDDTPLPQNYTPKYIESQQRNPQQHKELPPIVTNRTTHELAH